MIPPAVAIPAAVAAADVVGNIASSAFNVGESRKNRRWQERMSNTAHQREVQDLLKAGLNPILSASRGAAVPPGSAAQIQAPQVGKTLLESLSAKKNLELLTAQTRATNSQADLLDSQVTDQTATRPFRNVIPELEAAIKKQEVYKGDVDTSPQSLRKRAESIISVAERLKNESASSAYALSEQRVLSEFFKSGLGDVSPYLKVIMSLLRK